MKIKNEKTKKEYLILAFITLEKDKRKFKIFDIRELKGYILTDDSED